MPGESSLDLHLSSSSSPSQSSSSSFPSRSAGSEFPVAPPALMRADSGCPPEAPSSSRCVFLGQHYIGVVIITLNLCSQPHPAVFHLCKISLVALSTSKTSKSLTTLSYVCSTLNSNRNENTAPRGRRTAVKCFPAYCSQVHYRYTEHQLTANDTVSSSVFFFSQHRMIYCVECNRQ